MSLSALQPHVPLEELFDIQNSLFSSNCFIKFSESDTAREFVASVFQSGFLVLYRQNKIDNLVCL